MGTEIPKKVKVEMIQLASGPMGSYQPGSTYWLIPQQAKDFVKAGAAKYVKKSDEKAPGDEKVSGPDDETASITPPENTSKPFNRSNKGERIDGKKDTATKPKTPKPHQVKIKK